VLAKQTTASRPTRLAARAALPFLVAVIAAACGGQGGAASAPAPGATTNTGGAAATQQPGGGVATQAPAGGGETVDACALLSEADIKEVTGLDTESSTPGPQLGIFEHGCEWQLIDDDAIVPPAVVLGLKTSGGRRYYDTYFKPFNAGAGYETIAGLGDEAVDAEAGAVLVVAGDAFMNLQYVGLGVPEDDTELAAELARKVVANLGR
jgi:hypothetical protein